MDAHSRSQLSHELRTPLTGVLGYLELVLEDDDLSEEQRRNVKLAHGCGERLLDVVERHVLADATRAQVDPGARAA